MNKTTGSAVTTVVNRRTVVLFFALAYTLSWGSFVLAPAAGLFPFGPFLAAFISAWLTHGFAGLRQWAGRTVRWRIAGRWYAAALVLPMALAVVAVSLNVALGADSPSAVRTYSWASLAAIPPLALVDAPLWEEAGWRGYALPMLGVGRSRLASTLTLGVLLAGWHLPLALSGESPAAPYLIATLASAVVTNVVYYRSGESALTAILFHTAQNSAGGFFFFKWFSGAALDQLWLLFAAVYCVAALICLPMFGKVAEARPS